MEPGGRGKISQAALFKTMVRMVVGLTLSFGLHKALPFHPKMYPAKQNETRTAVSEEQRDSIFWGVPTSVLLSLCINKELHSTDKSTCCYIVGLLLIAQKYIG